MSLKFDGLDELQNLLGDKTLKETEIEGGPELKGDFTFEAGDLKLGLKPNASFVITKFDEPRDKDPDNVLGVPKESDPPSSALKPQIRFDPGRVWLKYRSSFGIESSVSSNGDTVTAGLEAGASVAFSDYRFHDPEERVFEAVSGDLSDFRLASVLEDVLGLEPGEALTFRVGGDLNASLGLKWSEVFNSVLPGLSAFLRAGSLISLVTTVGAAVDFKVSISDEFILVFTRDRRDSSLIRVAVRKADSVSTEVGVKLSVGVAFADPSLVESVILEKILPSVIQDSVERIDQLLAKASLDDLTDLEKRAIKEVLKRVGFGEAIDSIERARDAWESFKKKFLGVVEAAAKAKVEAALTYTYLRTRAEATLLQCLLTGSQVAQFHPSLLKKNISPILEKARREPDSIVLEDYLHESRVLRVRTLGFSLGIGPWKALDRDTLKDDLITQTNFAGDVRLAYLGSRSFFGKGFDSETVSFTVDFRAEMPTFRAPGSATTSDFDFALALDYAWNEARSLTQGDLEEILDSALVWNIIQRHQVEEIRERLGPRIRNHEESKIALSLKFPVEQFGRLRKWLRTDLAGDRIYLALGRAMPYWSQSQYRTDVELRKKLYAPLWKAYFRWPELEISKYAQDASRHVRKADSDLEQFEVVAIGGAPGRGNNRTFAMVIQNSGETIDHDYSGIKDRWEWFRKGYQTLDQAIETGAGYRVIEESFKGMVRFWREPFFVRTLACYLTSVADEIPEIGSKLERSLTFTFGEDVITFGVSRPSE